VTPVITTSASGTEALARSFAKTLQAGDWVFLEGPLGAGKTVFARAVCEEILGPHSHAGSPSFPIASDYGRVVHADLYRLESPDDLFHSGIMSLPEERPDAIVVVEWGDRFPIFKQQLEKFFASDVKRSIYDVRISLFPDQRSIEIVRQNPDLKSTPPTQSRQKT
jgi:tRNA threonylcarbamoyl adenosine modification protein YjeE